MNAPCYPRTSIPVRRGDLVRWYDDEEPSEVLFVISTGDFPDSESLYREWLESEFVEGVMINTPSAGWVLESEDCENITLLRRFDEHA